MRRTTGRTTGRTMLVGLLVLLPFASACPPPTDGPDQPIAPTGEGGTWEERAALGLGPRQETAVVALRDEVYVIGGFAAGVVVVPTVEAYDPDDDQWRQVADLPLALHHGNAAALDDRLYVLGSLTGLSFQANPRAFRYDPDDDSWTELAPLPAPSDRGGGAAVALGGRLWVLGGVRASEATDEVHRYDPSSDTWEAMPFLPEPRDHLVAGVIDDVIYAAGGRLGGISTHAATLWAFDPDVGVWEERAPLPTSRAGAAGAVAGGRLFVMGGEGNPEDPSGVFPHVEAYDPATDAWETLAPMPTPRHGMGAAALDDVIYVPGGATEQGLGADGTHEAYTP